MKNQREQDAYILRMVDIRKTFGELVANDDVNLNVKKGSVHALVGENGAGKSTLMNILSGMYRPDSGDIILNGKRVTFRNSLEATQAGIGMVHQEFMLYSRLTVFENIILGFEYKTGPLINRQVCRKQVEEICQKYRFNIPLDEVIKELPVAMLQQVEIVKALYRGSDILILDEPTSVLTPSGIEGLFDAIRFLVSGGKTIILITHKLREVFEIADNITVLKDGKEVGSITPRETDQKHLASMMVGREVFMQANRREHPFGEELLRVKNLSVKDKDGILRVKNASFSVRAGEIVGLAGVAGSGQQQLVEALFGLREPEAGSEITFEGISLLKMTPAQRRKLGIGYVPQDRMKEGTNPNASIWESAIMGYHIAHGFRSKFWLDHKAIDAFTDSIVEEFRVKRQKNTDKVRSLSGGNIQKLVVGRECLQKNKLLIVEDPTRGIDVGAIEFIWEKIIDLAAQGVAVLLVSHELNEILQLSDRILVAYSGELADGGRNGEYTEEQIGYLMLGGSV
ncbi:MAG: ABC transporter ATP-binding protein [Oscillospiraceae bacterium]|nr:ABC transporter ATP-binding protein [Oscillospiraceae bacterium]